jgi:hypothetical protein
MKKTFMEKLDLQENPADKYFNANRMVNSNKAVNKIKTNPLYLEAKSRRVQLLMQPSLFDTLKNLATKKGVSVNELICQTLKIFAKTK